MNKWGNLDKCLSPYMHPMQFSPLGGDRQWVGFLGGKEWFPGMLPLCVSKPLGWCRCNDDMCSANFFWHLMAFFFFWGEEIHAVPLLVHMLCAWNHDPSPVTELSFISGEIPCWYSTAKKVPETPIYSAWFNDVSFILAWICWSWWGVMLEGRESNWMDSPAQWSHHT